MRILMVTVPVTAMNATARELAGGIVLNVPGLLLHVVVPVPGLSIIARVVLIHLAPAGMLLAVVIPAAILRMLLELTAEESVSPATARVAARILRAEAIIRMSARAVTVHALMRTATAPVHAVILRRVSRVAVPVITVLVPALDVQLWLREPIRIMRVLLPGPVAPAYV
jgi:hypothetical protein